MEFRGLTLDKFQIAAANALDNGHSVVVSAPTGCGKTIIAEYCIDKAIHDNKRVFYTAPIKALSNQKYKDFSEYYGEEMVGLITGDRVVNPDAQIVVMTAEIFRNRVVTQDDLAEDVSFVVFDEIHYINDPHRGTVWEESVIFSPKHMRFVCLSATISNAEEFANWISTIKGHEVETIVHHERVVPLDIKFYQHDVGVASLDRIKKHYDIPSYNEFNRGAGRGKKIRETKPNHMDLVLSMGDKFPGIFFCFSRKVTEKYADELGRNKKIKKELQPKVSKAFIDLPEQVQMLNSARVLRRTLPRGIGFHHAGMLPALKAIVEEFFEAGDIDVLYATETFSVGINMPARTVMFDSLWKYNGTGFAYVNTTEFFQMAGRAGRRGLDTKGYVVPMISKQTFAYDKIKKITAGVPDPIRSQFKLSPSTVLNLIEYQQPKRIDAILKHSFYTYKSKRNYEEIKRSFSNFKKLFEKHGYVVDGELTAKGKFASKLFVDEILLTEIFSSNDWKRLNSYDMLLLIGSLCYEPRRERHKRMDEARGLHKRVFKLLLHHDDPRSMHAKELEGFFLVLMKTEDFFAISEATPFHEGDLLRFLYQVQDRIRQLLNVGSAELVERLEECMQILNKIVNILE